MHLEKIIVVMAVLLFFGLGVAILVIMDHKARIKDGFKHDLFTVSGIRRDHPVESFLTMTILLGIILALVLSLFAVIGSKFGIFQEEEQPEILATIGEERMVERMRHFHNAPKHNFDELGNKNVCFYCHGDYPHSKEPMIRTLMNMHTQFIGCLTCHADKKKFPEDTYRFEWLNYSGIEVKGVPFGTQLNPNTGQLIETDDYFSKIVVYAKVGDEEKLLELTEDDGEVQEFLAIRDTLSEKDRNSVKKRFHRTVTPKGRFCSRCHTEEKKSYLPFRQLGFSDQRIFDVTNLNILGLINKYEEFYMPNLLSSDRTVNEGKEPAKTSDNNSTKTLSTDPRAWWREKYDSPTTKKQ